MATIAEVPIEEIFFFVIQSIFTSQLYILFGLFETPSQHLIYPTHTLVRKVARYGPLFLLPGVCLTGWKMAIPETHTFYLGCIMWWITPVMTFLWFVAGDHFLSRGRTAALTISIPTVYLCIVDTIALRAGTWHITERTSTGIFVWPDLPLEEFTFFLVTNTLLVCGMSAFERSFAVIDVFGDILAESVSSTASTRKTAPQPSLLNGLEFVQFLVKSLTLRIESLPSTAIARIPAFEETQEVLAVHSRSFHTASYIFPTAVRRDLVILYAFCRVLDDFCDESPTKEEARSLIEMSKEWLDLLYPSSPKASLPTSFEISAFLHKRVPKEAQSSFFLLSTISGRIPRYPFDDLIAGYEWDLECSSRPVVTEADLVEYSRLVASSVAEMCVWAMWANEGTTLSPEEQKHVLAKAASMGVALQITNIARDIREDASKGRIYVPQDWFKESGAGDYTVLKEACDAKVAPKDGTFPYATYLKKLLDLAEIHKEGTSEAIRKLPSSCQAGIRAATKVYIGIGGRIEQAAFVDGDRAKGMPKTSYEGQRISLSGKERVKIALREMYLNR